jgi:heat shock protein HslJ
VPVGERYTLSFKGDLIRAKFCNSMSGHYTLADGVLESDLATTQMSCSAPDDVMALEENFWKMLGSGSTATFAGGKLTLSSGLRTMVFAPAR